MRVQDFLLYNATNVIASANTDRIEMEQAIGLAIQVTWASGTASATATLQVSNDGTNWANTSITQTILNNSGTGMLEKVDFMQRYARVALTHTSGTITSLSMRVCAKGI